MKKRKSIASKISSWIFMIILLVLVYKLFGIYKINYFNGFTKAESNIGISKFSRDNTVKYSEGNSYKIVSEIQNNAAFYKKIEVKPNTAYKVTCMVKTENVIPSDNNTDGGANICIIEGAEISKSVTGTSDWQKIQMIFNSQDKTSVEIGFRLGGNSGTALGTAWFSDFKVEKGIIPEDSNWKFACFIFKNIDVNIDGNEMDFTMSLSDIENIKSDMKRFQTSCKKMSNNQMQVEYDIYEIDNPITTISYSDEHGYYIDPYDINDVIEDKVLEKEYDYIFAAIRMGNEKKAIPVKDWIGLRKYGLIWCWIFKYKNAK